MQFEFNYYYHFYMQFPANTDWSLVPNTEYLIYAGERRGYYSVWQNFGIYYEGSNILQCTVVDEEAERIHKLTG